MKKLITIGSGILLCLAMLVSCQKDSTQTTTTPTSTSPTCPYATTANATNLQQKWMNTFTQIDTYSNSGAIQNSSVINPIGYFKINSDGTYNVYSNNATLNGSWTINKNCQLVLDSAKSLQRNFDILSLSKDSLTIRRKQGNTVYTQHYKTFSCPDATKLEFTWNNTFIKSDYYYNGALSSSYVQYPVGYFRLNADATYNVVSNGVPLNGKWVISQNNCQLVLDQSTTLERSFQILQATNDSLVIQRKDTSVSVQPIIYTQHYKKN